MEIKLSDRDIQVIDLCLRLAIRSRKLSAIEKQDAINLLDHLGLVKEIAKRE